MHPTKKLLYRRGESNADDSVSMMTPLGPSSPLHIAEFFKYRYKTKISYRRGESNPYIIADTGF